MDRGSLAVARDRVGHVGLLEAGDLLVGQRELLGCDRVFEVLDLRRPDYRSGEAGLVQQPRERDTGRRLALLTRDLFESLDDVEVDLGLV